MEEALASAAACRRLCSSCLQEAYRMRLNVQDPVPTGGLDIAEDLFQCDCLQKVPNAFRMLEASRTSALSALHALRPRFL